MQTRGLPSIVQHADLSPFISFCCSHLQLTRVAIITVMQGW